MELNSGTSKYQVVGNTLQFPDSNSEPVVLKYSICKVMSAGDKYIVLYGVDDDDAPAGNLLAVDPIRGIVWNAEDPAIKWPGRKFDTKERYFSAGIVSGELLAYGHDSEYSIDLNSGKIIRCTFTK